MNNYYLLTLMLSLILGATALVAKTSSHQKVPLHSYHSHHSN